MQFLFVDSDLQEELILDVKEYKHIFKVRRVKKGDSLDIRNMSDDLLYTYDIESIDKKNAVLRLKNKRVLKIEPKKYLHVSWCVVDPKTIEKTLPFLNELGVSKLSFVYCDFSQKNFKIDLQRLRRILINSSQQCGRSSLMEIEILDSVNELLKLYPDMKIIDFCENKLTCKDSLNSFLIGCEGGFSQKERSLFDNDKTFGLDVPAVLRSETALLYVTSVTIT